LHTGAVDPNEAQVTANATTWTPCLARAQNKRARLAEGCSAASFHSDAIRRLILAKVAGTTDGNARQTHAAKHVVSALAARGAEAGRDVFLLRQEQIIGDGAGLTQGVCACGAALEQLSKGADKGRAKLTLALWFDRPRDANVTIRDANVRGGGPDLPRKRRRPLAGNTGLERAPRIAHLLPLSCSSFH